MDELMIKLPLNTKKTGVYCVVTNSVKHYWLNLQAACELRNGVLSLSQ